MKKKILAKATVRGSSKGQLVIPTQIRDAMRYRIGDEFTVIYDVGRDELILKRQKAQIEDLSGILHDVSGQIGKADS